MTNEIRKYDPELAPDAEGWLALDESDRIDLVVRYHRRAHVTLPNAKVHALIHSVVESQFAMGDETRVRRTVERLTEEGLDRHDAIHAVGSVLAKHMYGQMKEGVPAGDPNDAYWAELEKLSAKEWRRAR